MNKTIKIITGFLVLVLILMLPNVVFGASASISAGSKTIEKGKSTSITVSINATETWNLKISSSGGSLSGTIDSTDASDGETSKQVINATFSANSAGTYTVYLTGQIAGNDLVKKNISTSVQITVKEPTPQEAPEVKDPVVNDKPAKEPGTTTNKPITTTPKKEETKKSSNNTLSKLTVAEGEITPVFEKDVREYALTIPYEITEVNVTATPSNSKATVAVEGNKDLKEGENIINVKVTEEDGTVANYIIKVTRKRVPVALKSLIIRYENQEGQIIEIPLNPTFNFATLEYTLQDLEYWVEKLTIEAVANIEGATIDIQGAETLQTGENIITVTVKILEQNTPEGEEPKEETIVYTIKVNKPEEPTLMAKTSNWFKGIMGAVGTWFNNNQPKIILGALVLCIVALIGLSIYIVVDYNKYKDVIAKVKKATEINTNAEIVEEVEYSSNIAEQEIIEDNDKDDKPKRGKHF